MFDRYVVKYDDTLDKIASKFETMPSIIRDINNLYSGEIREGMELVVPKENKEYFNYYTVVSGDTLYGIARRYNINPELLSSINGINQNDYIYPDQQILIPKSGYSYYITASGDTLDTVSNTFKVDNFKGEKIGLKADIIVTPPSTQDKTPLQVDITFIANTGYTFDTSITEGKRYTYSVSDSSAKLTLKITPKENWIQ